MSIVIEQRMQCDYCRKSHLMKNGVIKVPTGWQEVDEGYGNITHCCWWPSCIEKFKEDHPDVSIECTFRPTKSKHGGE